MDMTVVLDGRNGVHTADGGIQMDGGDYVSYDSRLWGLPDNTHGQIGRYVSYRPLCGDDKLISPAILEATKIFFAAARAAHEARKAAADAQYLAKLRGMDPVAETEKHKKEKEYDEVQNEGGEGYNPYR